MQKLQPSKRNPPYSIYVPTLQYICTHPTVYMYPPYSIYVALKCAHGCSTLVVNTQNQLTSIGKISTALLNVILALLDLSR